MTIRGFGRVTPVQMDMLCLAGAVFQDRRITKVAKDVDRMQSMREARARLIRLTGQDFGYDLAEWHAYLTSLPSEDDHGYQHAYAKANVHRSVKKSLDDPHRAKLIERILEGYPPMDVDA